MARKQKPIPVVDDDILINGQFYKGNEQLLNKNAKIGFTPEMLEELKSCTKNVLFFAERHFNIITEDGREVIKLRPFQKKILKNLKNFKRHVLCCTRQAGKTTIVSVYALWKACFFDHQRIAILANKGETAEQIFERVRMAFENLPMYLKPAVKSWRKNGFDLTNGSSIIISSASSSSIRGRSINCVSGDSIVTMRNKLTGEIFKIPMKNIPEKIGGIKYSDTEFILDD